MIRLIVITILVILATAARADEEFTGYVNAGDLKAGSDGSVLIGAGDLLIRAQPNTEGSTKVYCTKVGSYQSCYKQVNGHIVYLEGQTNERK